MPPRTRSRFVGRRGGRGRGRPRSESQRETVPVESNQQPEVPGADFCDVHISGHVGPLSAELVPVSQGESAFQPPVNVGVGAGPSMPPPTTAPLPVFDYGAMETMVVQAAVQAVRQSLQQLRPLFSPPVPLPRPPPQTQCVETRSLVKALQQDVDARADKERVKKARVAVSESLATSSRSQQQPHQFVVGSFSPTPGVSFSGHQGLGPRRGQASVQAGFSWTSNRPQGSQSIAAPRDIQECSFCHIRHPGECRRKTGACFNCGKMGHLARKCPYSAANQSQAGSSQSRPDKGKRKKTNENVYALAQQRSRGADEETPGRIFIK